MKLSIFLPLTPLSVIPSVDFFFSSGKDELIGAWLGVQWSQMAG